MAARLTGLDVARISDGESTVVRHKGFRAYVRRHGRAIRSSRVVDVHEDNLFVCDDLYRTAHVRYGLTRCMTAISGNMAPSIMHWTYPLPIYWRNVQNVVTIHDIIPVIKPEMSGISAKRLRSLLLACVSRADAVVTVSDVVRQDILANLPISPEKVVNLGQPICLEDHEVAESAYSPSVAPEGGFLYFGTVERRKNVGRIIAAHAASGTMRPLTIIGNDGWEADNEWAALRLHPNPELVRRVAWCSRPSLLRAIREARAVVFPSLAEGFGLPIVEAMALGTPVITSRGHATEEIASAGAFLIDPCDVQEIARAIASLDRSDDIRAAYVQRGLARASDFSMHHFAQRLHAFYTQLPVRSLPL